MRLFYQATPEESEEEEEEEEEEEMKEQLVPVSPNTGWPWSGKKVWKMIFSRSGKSQGILV